MSIKVSENTKITICENSDLSLSLEKAKNGKRFYNFKSTIIYHLKNFWDFFFRILKDHRN